MKRRPAVYSVSARGMWWDRGKRSFLDPKQTIVGNYNQLTSHVHFKTKRQAWSFVARFPQYEMVVTRWDGCYHKPKNPQDHSTVQYTKTWVFPKGSV